jgi:hypothetical protein
VFFTTPLAATEKQRFFVVRVRRIDPFWKPVVVVPIIALRSALSIIEDILLLLLATYIRKRERERESAGVLEWTDDWTIQTPPPLDSSRRRWSSPSVVVFFFFFFFLWI